MEHLIELRDVYKIYQMGDEAVHALDGISLTVAGVTERDFSVSVIPHTAAVTILGGKGPGDVVNLETDIIGKYVEKLLRPRDAEAAPAGGLTLEFLAQNGF